MNQISEETARHERGHTLDLTIVNNGLLRPIAIDRDATVKSLVERAIALFGNIPAPHTQSLWTEKGVELTNEQETLKAAHIKDGDTLLLRPGAVKGGQS
jgi:D-alanyl-D-alanine dipeptidase